MPGVGVLLAAGAVYDAWAIITKRQTISAGWRELVKHPTGRLIAGAGIGILVAHLTES